ncbi:GDSL esterase/lipase 6 [Camellia lanceoleosa]|uniref:GDSL esterase/lipase 6 n=1 Tax=Camellia lanceoleosa TaxID=1840588 RepID=A0ACC0I2U7_9ERIC|nr:GDSL esterase/lipase 6 [Camellia lanceoleosa]
MKLGASTSTALDNILIIGHVLTNGYVLKGSKVMKLGTSIALDNILIIGLVLTNVRRSSLESLFCYDKVISEEIIEKPIGLSLSEKKIGDNLHCPDCQAKGAVLCSTCSGSGLYVDSILESQGIIVKVRCLAQFVGIELQKPYLELQSEVVNGSMKEYPSNGINFASAGSGVLRGTNHYLIFVFSGSKLTAEQLEDLIPTSNRGHIYIYC